MANYQAIIDAIDAALLTGVSGPGEITTPVGGTIKYRSLDELTRTRKTYADLLSQSTNGGGRRFGLRQLQSGSARGEGA